MRKINHISPTAFMLYQRDKEAFYLQYLADNRPPREPQNQAMAIGAAFDAYVKTFLSREFSTKPFIFEQIFENQVEPHNRKWAATHGAWAFDSYKKSGALADLMFELQGTSEEPRFEMSIENRVGRGVDLGVPLFGKPDIHYKLKDGRMQIIHDWKVNGYMSPKTTSPKKGYIELYDAGEKRGFHKDIMPKLVDGIYVNGSYGMDTVSLDWAIQTTIYAWILGISIGEEFWIGIHQLCCKNGGEGRFPVIRVAAHRGGVTRGFQESLYTEIKGLWENVQKGTILDPERQEVLDRFYSGEDKDDFLEVIR